jgi:hypothetical protein
VFGVGQSEGPEPNRLESSDPKREADEPSTWAYALCKCHIECSARPTGTGMVAPPKPSRF